MVKVLPFFRDAVGVLYSPSRLGKNGFKSQKKENIKKIRGIIFKMGFKSVSCEKPNLEGRRVERR